VIPKEGGVDFWIMLSWGSSSPEEAISKEMEPCTLGSLEMKSDALKMPAFEKHARKGGMVT
jgi:hypothetical protein